MTESYTVDRLGSYLPTVQVSLEFFDSVKNKINFTFNSWLFTALFAAGAIAMVCGFVRNGNEFNFADPIGPGLNAFFSISRIFQNLKLSEWVALILFYLP